MQKRHKNRKLYFDEQAYTTSKYVIPFINQSTSINSETRVLEIGCGEGGNLVPFLQIGCEVVGIDLCEPQIERARKFLEETCPNARYELKHADIYQVTVAELAHFDLIIMRDVIEHIIDQEKFMAFLGQFLTPGGQVFFGFPPWCMPFGGHQQICKSRMLSVMPYFHLLPYALYRSVLFLFGELEDTIQELVEIKKTGISIERFRKILDSQNYRIIQEQIYLINPNYEVKFNLKPRRQWELIGRIPVLRNFISTCCYSLISKDSGTGDSDR